MLSLRANKKKRKKYDLNPLDFFIFLYMESGDLLS
jgi:hypothetical protein